MQIIYAGESAPQTYSKSIFLAGPTPRDELTLSWRPAMNEALKKAGYDGVVFVPEPRDRRFKCNYHDQVEWERQHLEMSDRIVFWVPRNLENMPAFTTNVEFGRYVTSGKILYGRPDRSPKNSYLDWLYQKDGADLAINDMDELARAVVYETDENKVAAERSGGERYVPLDIWKTASFQMWYGHLQQAGNRLDEARVLWAFYIHKAGRSFVFAYALWAKVWIEKEQRWKSNEFLISRPDVAVVLPIYRAASHEEHFNTKVVLIKEFRVPVRNSVGLVVELPGGSSFKPTEDPRTVAAHELKEETGLDVSPNRFYSVGTRQVASTLSSHVAVVLSVELTEEEIQQMEVAAQKKTTFGLETETEKTYIEVKTLGQLLGDENVDWSMLGMILAGTANV